MGHVLTFWFVFNILWGGVMGLVNLAIGSDDAKDEAAAAPRERLAEPLRIVGLLEPAHQYSLQLVFFIAFKLDSPSFLGRRASHAGDAVR